MKVQIEVNGKLVFDCIVSADEKELIVKIDNPIEIEEAIANRIIKHLEGAGIKPFKIEGKDLLAAYNNAMESYQKKSSIIAID